MVVYNCKIEPNYFWDEMSIKEVEVLLNNYNIDYQNEWNQTRFICYINSLLQGNKLKSPEDLIKFSWEKTLEDDLNVIAEDPEVVKQRMLEMINNLNDENKVEFNPEYIFQEIFNIEKEKKQE